MLKKTVFASIVALTLCSPAMAIEPPSGATSGFNAQATAYPSVQFNQILEGYGLSLPADAVAGVPDTYATSADGKLVFNNNFKAYTPEQYHAIFTSYGLNLTPDAVSSKLGISSYAKVKGGEVVFGTAKLAFTSDEWQKILSAYEAPMQEVAAAPATPMDSDGDGVIDANDDCPGTPKGVVVNERGCWALSSELLFDFDSSVIKKDFYPLLDATKPTFDDNPAMKVVVEGHADSTGTDEYNQQLSEKRAKAVMNYLVNTLGIDAGRLSAVGYGENKPAFSNDSTMNRAKNRRVQFSPMM
jgi:OOP family OmpA-OmpF porin